jgi:hypothetical protein
MFVKFYCPSCYYYLYFIRTFSVTLRLLYARAESVQMFYASVVSVISLMMAYKGQKYVGNYNSL